MARMIGLRRCHSNAREVIPPLYQPTPVTFAVLNPGPKALALQSFYMPQYGMCRLLAHAIMRHELGRQSVLI